MRTAGANCTLGGRISQQLRPNGRRFKLRTSLTVVLGKDDLRVAMGSRDVPCIIRIQSAKLEVRES